MDTRAIDLIEAIAERLETVLGTFVTLKAPAACGGSRRVHSDKLRLPEQV